MKEKGVKLDKKLLKYMKYYKCSHSVEEDHENYHEREVSLLDKTRRYVEKVRLLRNLQLIGEGRHKYVKKEYEYKLFVRFAPVAPVLKQLKNSSFDTVALNAYGMTKGGFITEREAHEFFFDEIKNKYCRE